LSNEASPQTAERRAREAAVRTFVTRSGAAYAAPAKTASQAEKLPHSHRHRLEKMSRRLRSRADSCRLHRSQPCEVRGPRVGRLRADDGRELFAGRAAPPREAAERREQRATPPSPDADDAVQLGAQVAHRAGAAVEGHGEPVRLVADPLDEEQRGIAGAQ